MSRTAAVIYVKIIHTGLSLVIVSAELIVAVGEAEISRVPSNNFYYRCVKDHFEIFVRVYDQQFERQYRFYRSYL